MVFVYLKNPVIRLLSSFAKFLEILTTGSFLQKQSISLFRANAHALHLTGSFGNKQKLRITEFFASLPYLT